VLRPTFKNSEVHVRQFRFNFADFLKLGVSTAFVIDETNLGEKQWQFSQQSWVGLGTSKKISQPSGTGNI
jgi:hypothetical protein